jgi:hypothetical protein
MTRHQGAAVASGLNLLLMQIALPLIVRRILDARRGQSSQRAFEIHAYAKQRAV